MPWAGLTLWRAMLRDHPAIKLSRFAQTVAVRRDISEMRLIGAALRTDSKMLDFHVGRTRSLPAFYREHLGRRLGRYRELLSAEELRPLRSSDLHDTMHALSAQSCDAAPDKALSTHRNVGG